MERQPLFTIQQKQIMNNFFSRGSAWYPLRWFIIVSAMLIAWSSYADFAAMRLFSFTGGTATRGYYGSPSGHK